MSPSLAVGERPRIMFLVTEDWYLASHRLPLALALKERGADVLIMSRVSSDQLASLGLNIIKWKVRRGGIAPWGEVLPSIQVLQEVRRFRPHILHTIALKPVMVGGIVSRLCGDIPAVHAVAGLGHVYTSRSPVLRAVRETLVLGFRYAFRNPNSVVIFQNEEDISTLVGKGIAHKDRIALIRGAGVDMQEFTPTEEPSGPPVIVMASRLLWEKGVREFVEAASIVKGKGIESRWILVGASDPQSHNAIPTAQIQAWHDSGVIEWWGPRRDMASILAGCNLFVLPSFYREGLPKVLLEAAASGRAIVTTDMPGCRDTVEDGKTGIIVPPKDAKAVADAVITLLQDPERRRQMGLAGRELCRKKFAVELVIEATLRVYERLGVHLPGAGQALTAGSQGQTVSA